METPVDSDEFNSPKPGLQWQWHANPLQAYGFSSSYGYMRLYGQYYPDNFSNFWDIPNLLLQKFPAPTFTASTKLTAVMMNEGDKTGLIIMGWDYAYIALVKTDTGYALEYKSCMDAEQKTEEKQLALIDLKNIKINEKYNYKTPIPDVTIFLRVRVTGDGMCTFSYSPDGNKYEQLPQTFKARQGKWIGAKMGLFIMNQTVNTSRSYVDADWFRITR